MKDIFDDVVVSLERRWRTRSLRNRAAVAVFGTPSGGPGAELYGRGSTPVWSAWEEMRGSAEQLAVQYDEMGSSLGGVWRTILVEISPLTDKILDLITDLLPKFSAVADRKHTGYQGVVHLDVDGSRAVRVWLCSGSGNDFQLATRPLGMVVSERISG